MNLPLSTTILHAALTILRLLSFALAVLLLLLAIRAQFDENIALGWGQASLGALAFAAIGAACGGLRKRLEARIRRG
ncbi:MAG: hypothetical protein IOC54_11220 [Methylobacterium sp.]|nr:hypothetical protein [Methylobacterium sp.]MCA3652397.1 hypothetical protein [Methylobacterium sp.]MCA4922979.1 hypothetical protein [Methylobacterium sp.]